MVSCRLSRRTTICTSLAWRARYIAPWPAEFPPPTTSTRRPAIAGASVFAAP